ERQLTDEDLWFFLVKGKPMGPFDREDIATFLEENPHFPRDTKIANKVEQIWLSIYQIPHFQRRRPQVVPASQENTEEEQDYFILEGGQKSGPFSQDDIKRKIERKTLIYNSLISL